MNIKQYMQKTGERAILSSKLMAHANTAVKNHALNLIAQTILNKSDFLISENKKDMSAARNNGLEPALLERLELTPTGIKAMADGLNEVAALPDPVGEMTNMHYRPSGIQVGKMRVPLGVIGIIYESRPNVTVDAGCLCLKSGNASILRGGSEAIHSNQAIGQCIRDGLNSAGLPEDAVQVIEITEREAVSELLCLSEFVDVIIPRGGKELIKRVNHEAQMPVIKHLHGICHVYIDNEADIDKGIAIAYNAKTQRYAVCNAMECLLIAESIAEIVLQRLAPMYQETGVEIRGCSRSRQILPGIYEATEQDYMTEYLAPILSLKIVSGVNEAIDHIGKFGSKHTDSIVTENISTARHFLAEVDSSSVMINTSTRFADGFEYGLGAEIGISTDKIHARGPIGLEGLTSQKFIVLGDGHIRK